MQNNIYIIIATYNGMDWLPKCLASTRPYPVIIVDNDSTDGTSEYIEKEHSDIVLLGQKKNLGFGKANNIGISYALNKGADYVFLLNQDAYLFPDTIPSLMNVQDTNRSYGILSPVHINNSKNKLDTNFSNYVSCNNAPYFFSDFVLQKELQTIYEVPFINAAAWLISRACLEVVGGFDPIFFHYGEDDNFCQRVKYHSFRIGVVPSQFVIHDRENRRKKTIQPYTEEYLALKERGFKIQYGDINRDNVSGLKNNKKRLKKSIIKSLLFARLRLAKHYFRELKMIDRIIPEIQNSREQNKLRRLNYLNLNFYSIFHL